MTTSVFKSGHLLMLAALAIVLGNFASTAQESGFVVAPAASKYINQALDLMQQHSINTRDIDWPDVRKQTLEQAAGAQTTDDTYDAIRFALKQLNDRHSFLQLNQELARKDKDSHERRGVAPRKPGGSEKWPPSPYIDRRNAEGELLTFAGVRVAHIVIPLLENGNDAAMQSFATALEDHVVALARQSPQGWIIDVRGNLGGNMWPMLAGIAPLIDARDVGGFVDAAGKKTAWFLSADGAGLKNPDGSEQILCRVAAQRISFTKPPLIAVLMDRGTASSGEAVAIALRGQAGTRFFGRATHGQTTANEGYLLSDGANLVLATGIEADRTGKVYPSGLTPDVELPEQSEVPKSADTDPMILEAAQWIKVTSTVDSTSRAGEAKR